MPIDTDQGKTWRIEIQNLTDKELLDELNRPTHDWKLDVMREALYRLLKSK